MSTTTNDPIPPTDPLLAQLASTLSPEAYHAIEPILQNLATRVAATEATTAQVSTTQLQTAMQTAMAGANFTIQAPAASATGRPSTLRIELPIFKGTHLENVRAWISIIEDQLSASRIPRTEWGVSITALFRDTAQTWYLAKKRANGDVALSWDNLKTGLMAEYDSPTRIDELRGELMSIRYSGDVSNFIFTRPLPRDLAFHIRKTQPTTMAGVYEAARFWEQLNRFPSGHQHQDQHKKHPRPPPRTSTFTANSPFNSTSTHAPEQPSTAPAPMDLDNMDSKPKKPRPQGASQQRQQMFVFDDTTDDGNIPSDIVDEMYVLSVYQAHIARRRKFILPQSYRPVDTILDTAAPDNYIRQSAAYAINAEIFPISPRQVSGAGTTTTKAFAKFMLRVGNCKEITMAYVLEDSSGFRYDLLLGRNTIMIHALRVPTRPLGPIDIPLEAHHVAWDTESLPDLIPDNESDYESEMETRQAEGSPGKSEASRWKKFGEKLCVNGYTILTQAMNSLSALMEDLTRHLNTKLSAFS